MKNATKNKLLNLFIVLSIVGIGISIYLVNNHINPGGGACDLSETVSCSIVNTSKYSELFNVPVAVFGALWFVILGLLSWRAKGKRDDLIAGLLVWNVFGFLFVLYMIWAEFILNAICLFCTSLHVIIVITLILSYMMYKDIKVPSKSKLIKAAKPWLTLIIIINLIPLAYFNLTAQTTEFENLDEFAQCLVDEGFKMYGAFNCANCHVQRALFGDAFEIIGEIECHPRGEHPQVELCLEKDVSKTPTWIQEKDGVELNRVIGTQSLGKLAELSGCELG